MKNIRLTFIIVILSLISVNNLWSTHIVGGNFSYKCLGNQMYEISLTLRRDCQNGQAQFDNPATITVFDTTDGNTTEYFTFTMEYNGDDTLNERVQTQCGLIGGDVCVHTTTYKKVISLPENSSGYLFVYQRCCRNFTISNLNDPLEVGTTIYMNITAAALKSCNSSPNLGVFPPIYVCGGNAINFDLHTTDAEGDSVVFSLCPAFIGGSRALPMPLLADPPPYIEVPYKSPYNVSNMIGGTPLLNIHNRTGLMSGFAENIVAQYLVSYCVSEYRKGVLLSQLYREFQINVRICNTLPIADFKVEIDECKNPVTLKIIDQSRDLYSSINQWDWSFDNNGMISNSTLQNPILILKDKGEVKISLQVMSPEGCIDSLTKRIKYETIVPNLITNKAKICRGDSTPLIKSYTASANYSWTPNTNLTCSTCPNPIAFPKVSTMYYVNYSNGNCSGTDSVWVEVDPCITDSCAVLINEECLSSGMIRLTVRNYLGQIVNANRDHEILWDLYPPGATKPTQLYNQNPIEVSKNTKYLCTSKINTWRPNGPKTREFATTCIRKVNNTVSLSCNGPCADFELILSSCEDDYDKMHNLNFPDPLCISICGPACDFIIALFELNGNMVNPNDYEISWSNHQKGGAYVHLMDPYYDNLSVVVKKGDCTWYGRYVKSCINYKSKTANQQAKERSSPSRQMNRFELHEFLSNNPTFKLYNNSAQQIDLLQVPKNKKITGIYFLNDGIDTYKLQLIAD
ncbi:MAG: hypothetical protein WAS56_11160 [Saprospiraceae bacterium]